MKMFPSFNKFDLEAFMGSWTKFYKDVYGLNLTRDLAIPSINQAMGSGAVVVRSITIEQDLAEIKKRTKKNLLHRYINNNIDQLIQKDKEVTRPTGPYAFWTAPVVEATQQAPQLAEKSYNDIQKMEVSVMSFAEYVRFFLWHLVTTAEPLDRESWTLTGSLDTDGCVLFGYWHDDSFHVSWFLCDFSRPFIRFRQVVLPPLQ